MEAVQSIITHYLSPEFLEWDVDDLRQLLAGEIIGIGAFFKDPAFSERCGPCLTIQVG
jgi:hypothetical protein